MTEDLEPLRRAFRDIPACRVATLLPDGAPHVVPRWFVWVTSGLWVATRVGDDTWDHASRDPRASVVIDRGIEWNELAGVRIQGLAEPLPVEDPQLREPMSAWLEKYRTLLGGSGFERFSQEVPALGFLRMDPKSVRTWDHR
jgi:Pyridoxamine 5'-phosphate oxidase